MIDLTAVFRAVVEALHTSGVPYIVVGSTAAATWGVARATRDVDIVAMLSADNIEPVLSALDRADLYLPTHDARKAARSGGSFNVLHPSTGGKVDLFVAPESDRFTQSRLQRSITAEVLGTPARVATPEDVILAKLRWRLESRSEVQWRDCVEIAATQPLDTGYLSSWADELGVAADLGDLLDSI